MVAGLLAFAETFHHFALLARQNHGLETGADAPFRLGQSGGAFGVQFLERTLEMMHLGGDGGGATGGKEAAQLLLVLTDALADVFQMIQRLLAGEQGADVLFHCLLLLAVAQGLHRLKSESKCFHVWLGSFSCGCEGRLGGQAAWPSLGRAATSFAAR